MKRLTVGLSAVALLSAPTTPLAAAASLTREQLTQQCRPQMEAIIPGSISNLEAEVAEWQQVLKETPEVKDRGEPIIREDQQKIASLRADGIQGAAMRDMIDSYRQAGSKNSKAELRQALGEARKGSGPDAALAACILDAVLANLEGQPRKSMQPTNPIAVPPLRPTVVQEAHNPANDASQCLEPIAKHDFDRRGVRSIMGAVFRNACAYPVETQWCIGEDACSRGYGNVATLIAKHDSGFSFDPKADTITTVHWAACRHGFGYRPDLKGTLHYVCK